MFERFHRTLKQALLCHDTKFTKSLPVVLLGLRACIKEDLNVSCAEMPSKPVVRVQGLIPSLTAPYQEPFEVLSRTDKYFTININDRTFTINNDQLKPAFLLNDADSTRESFPVQKRSHPVVHPSRLDHNVPVPATTRSGRKVRFNPK
ncbi:retrovirus-related Pol polyprotein from transposon 412 [Trichonephila clavipes]|nr:retrovirus-related Pol polyprotein from transposon 412 [Trichonephila clavipes]